MVAVSHRHHLLNTLARCNRLHLVRPSLTGDRPATVVAHRQSWESIGAVRNSRESAKVSLGTLIKDARTLENCPCKITQLGKVGPEP
jgi:hypothetical protein